MYKKLLVLAALMSAVCFTAVAEDYTVTVKGITKKGKRIDVSIPITDDSAAAAKEAAKAQFKFDFPDVEAGTIVVTACSPKKKRLCI